MPRACNLRRCRGTGRLAHEAIVSREVTALRTFTLDGRVNNGTAVCDYFERWFHATCERQPRVNLPPRLMRSAIDAKGYGGRRCVNRHHAADDVHCPCLAQRVVEGRLPSRSMLACRLAMVGIQQAIHVIGQCSQGS